MKLSEIKNYLLDHVTEYSVETPNKGHYLTFKQGEYLLSTFISGEDNAIYELLKEYDIKYVYIKSNNSFGICFTDNAANAIISLGNLCKNSKNMEYSTRDFIDLEDSLDDKINHFSFDPLDVDLPY